MGDLPSAAFVPEVKTKSEGHANVTVHLPQSVTRYRVVARAASGARNFGRGEETITARLSLALRPAAPRFLNHGDHFELAVVVQNPTASDATVQLATRAENAQILGPRGFRFTVPARDRIEAHFDAMTELPGVAAFQIAAASSLGADAVRVDVPVWTPATTESFAQYGELAEGSVGQRVHVPSGVIPEYGGLELRTSATALGGIEDLVRAVLEDDTPSVECLAARTLTLAGLRTMWPALKGAKLGVASRPEPLLARDIEQLEAQQNAGGWRYWGRGSGAESPWISIFATHALVVAKQRGSKVDEETLKRALAHLGRLNPLCAQRPVCASCRARFHGDEDL